MFRAAGEVSCMRTQACGRPGEADKPSNDLMWEVSFDTGFNCQRAWNGANVGVNVGNIPDSLSSCWTQTESESHEARVVCWLKHAQ